MNDSLQKRSKGMEFRLQAEYGGFETFRLKMELHVPLFIESHRAFTTEID
jgi:hypothetical protein